MHRDFPLDVKKVDDETGLFEGYASVFGVLDSYAEKVAPGAFAESLARHKREGTSPLMLWQHDSREVIGVWTDLAEDGKGLRVSGQLLKGVRRADEALILLRAGAVRGLSIGYREELVDDSEKGVRVLKKVNLFEVSVVSIPANPRARVDAVKSDLLDAFAVFGARLRAGDAAGEDELALLLRKAGADEDMAKRIASCGYGNAIRSKTEGKEAQAESTAFLTALVGGLRR